MAAEKKSFVLYHDIRTPLELLTDEQRGKLFLALLNYSEYGELPDFDGALLMAFAFIRTSLDRDAEAWAEKRAKRAEAGRSGGLAKVANASNASSSKQNVANLAVPVSVSVPVPVNVNTPNTSVGRRTAASPPRAARFTPPTVDEVKTYCVERGSSVDPEKFVDFYSANGWKQGKNKPIVDWKAAVRTWERSDAQQKAQDQNRVRTSAEYREEADFFG
jgi:hypothetical protein